MRNTKTNLQIEEKIKIEAKRITKSDTKSKSKTKPNPKLSTLKEKTMIRMNKNAFCSLQHTHVTANDGQIVQAIESHEQVG
jgi:hypothetical protein